MKYDREKDAFFKSVRKQEEEWKQRRDEDVELRKRWLLKCMTNGFGRNQSARPKTITLPKFSIQEDKK